MIPIVMRDAPLLLLCFLSACSGTQVPNRSSDTSTDTDPSSEEPCSSQENEDTGHKDTGSPEQPADPFPLLPAVPLHTEDRWILDAHGKRFKLASVNWYGFEELDYVPAGLEIAHVSEIAHAIADLGFNSVRLPFSLEMAEQTTPVQPHVVAANPEFAGLTPMEVMDGVIDALAVEGLVVVLDNHSSEAVWYSATNGLWYTEDYSEADWIGAWETLAGRYKGHPAVVGYDLRNELRAGATWGGPPATDWKAAASRAADAIFAVDDSKLIVVEAINYATDFTGHYWDPLELSVSHRLVLSPHDYSWFHGGTTSYEQLARELGDWWGFLIVQDMPFTAPVWVGEFGTCNWSEDCFTGEAGDGTVEDRFNGAWFAKFIDYLAAGDIDWAYWAVNGTMAR
ncbi:MAG: cellulase family glycosylhydrolase, partial [Myxococcota bacterium]|nr:cellulase family glycosylhydrolase [Myxococcota bacterium]